MLTLHGAAYLGAKIEHGVVHDRAMAIGKWAAILVVALYAIAGVWLALGIAGYQIDSAINPAGPANPLRKEVSQAIGAWLDNYGRYPWMIAAPALGFAGAGLAGFTLGRKPGLAMLGSGLAIAGIIASVGASMFPFILPSSANPMASLTVWDSSSSHLTLFIMLIATLVFLPIVLFYTSWVLKVLWGRLSTDEANSPGHY
jgi:cytochrome d ubiquinol oxidase subunit II